MPTVHLRDRAIIAVEGVDASFLQNIITADSTARRRRGSAERAAVAARQIHSISWSRGGNERLLLECRAALADDFVRRLTLYKLRAKAAIAKRDQAVVAVTWRDDSSASQTDSSAGDTRFPKAAKVVRHYGAPLPAQDASENDWNQLRIENGVAESGFDYEAGDAFPHDVLLDENGGVGFRKGCHRPGSGVAHAAPWHRPPPGADRRGHAPTRARHRDAVDGRTVRS